ncbi:MAG: monofunctional biosynthetic peptidoglycan transglycosylase [Castellaniella sp.]
MRRWKTWRTLLAALLLGLFAFLLYQFGLLVMVIWLSFRNPGSTAFIDAARSELRIQGKEASIARVWVDYDHISPHLKRAVVASEDSGFMAHSGVEWAAMRQAWAWNRQQAAEGSSRRRGGSTITQQLAKNLFLSSSRSYRRKAQELILALMLEVVMSKRRILELYLNVAQWGETTFGAQAAAQQHFGTSVAKLSAAQAARLAAMLPNPRYYEEQGTTRFLTRHSQTLLRRMPQVDIP